jgi:hypothetical protein
MKIADLNKRISGQLNGFYRGVVEDNLDPEKRGRVRVRIFGVHTKQKIKTKTEGIPTAELPWAEPILPMVEGAISGFGMWSVPLQGSHVMVFFENSNMLQPRYFGTVPGVPVEPPVATEGFNDPAALYPQTRLDEPDYHRLARGESDQTAVTSKNFGRRWGVTTADGLSWNEPASPYAAQYPHNFVMAFHGGLIMEFDSTPGATRININHLQSGSYFEMSEGGQMVIKNTGNRYDITTIGSRYESADINFNISATANVNIQANAAVNIESVGLIKINAAAAIDITGAGTVDITGGGAVTITGSIITLN